MGVRRRRLLLFGATVLALLGVAGYFLFCCPERVTLENYEKVKVGMTLEGVEDILGPPEKRDVLAPGPISTFLKWENNHGFIRVDTIWVTIEFNGGRVRDKHILVVSL
jgi:hypothetical protein